MAWGARPGLKFEHVDWYVNLKKRLNSLACPSGFPPKMWGEGGKEAKGNRKVALKTFLESKQAPLQEQPH